MPIDLRINARQLVLKTIPPDSEGAEIGVHMGHFSAAILAAASPRRLHLIDPWSYRTEPEYESAWYGKAGAREGQRTLDDRYEYVRQRFSGEISAGRVVLHRMSSVDALHRLQDQSLDWVYIDGDHTYNAVQCDLELSRQKVKAGGLIFGDDYGSTGWWRNGVTAALHEFLFKTGSRLLFLHGTQFAVRL